MRLLCPRLPPTSSVHLAGLGCRSGLLRRGDFDCHGCYSIICCASLVRSAGVFTTSLSTPGVFLPSLICDTRRTLVRAFALLLSISFCRDLTFLRFPSLVALKIRCRKLRIDVSACRQLTQFQSTDSEVTFVLPSLNIQFIPADFALTLRFSVSSPDSRQP